MAAQTHKASPVYTFAVIPMILTGILIKFATTC